MPPMCYRKHGSKSWHALVCLLLAGLPCLLFVKVCLLLLPLAGPPLWDESTFIFRACQLYDALGHGELLRAVKIAWMFQTWPFFPTLVHAPWLLWFEPVTAVRLCSIALSGLCILLSAALLRSLVRQWALPAIVWTALAVCCMPCLRAYACKAMLEPLLVVLCLGLALLLTIRIQVGNRWRSSVELACGALLAATLMTKLQYGFIFGLGMLGACLADSDKSLRRRMALLRLFGPATLFGLAWFAFPLTHKLLDAVRTLGNRSSGLDISGHLLYYPRHWRNSFGPSLWLLLPLPWGLWRALRDRRVRPTLLLLLSAALLLLLHRYKQPRFALPFVPLIYVLSGYGLAELWLAASNLKIVRKPLLVGLALFAMFSVPAVLRPWLATLNDQIATAADQPQAAMQVPRAVVSRWAARFEPCLLAGSFNNLSPDSVRIALWLQGADPYKLAADEGLDPLPASLESVARRIHATSIVRIVLHSGSPFIDDDYKGQRLRQAGVPVIGLEPARLIMLRRVGLELELYLPPAPADGD